jgi:hypothetical protein
VVALRDPAQVVDESAFNTGDRVEDPIDPYREWGRIGGLRSAARVRDAIAAANATNTESSSILLKVRGALDETDKPGEIAQLAGAYARLAPPARQVTTNDAPDELLDRYKRAGYVIPYS